MDCRQCQNNISAYIDGQLGSSLMSAIEQHLNECPRCREEYKAIVEVRMMCMGLCDVDPPSGFHNQLVERLKREGRKNVIKKINRKVLAGVVAAVIVVFAAALAMSNLGGIGGVRDEEIAQSKSVPPAYDMGDGAVSQDEAAVSDRAQDSVAESPNVPKEGSWDAADRDAGGGVKGEAASDVALASTSSGFAGTNRGAATGEPEKSAAEATQALGSQAEGERKIIRSAYVGLETTEFDRTVDEIIGKVGVYLGYIESSEIQGKPRQYEGQVSNRKAHFEIRIPKKSFDQFITNVGELGNVVSRQIRGEDITGQYLDVEARLKSLRLQEERLLTILGKAEQLQDIIELERELSRVRYEIENYTGTLKQWDNMVEYSRISLDVYEVQEIKKEEPVPATWGDKIINSFIKSCRSLLRLFENLVVFVVSAIPYLVVLAVIGWGLWGIAIRPRIGKKVDKVDKIEERKEGDHEQ